MKIAIDGPAAAGKTTLAKGISEKLGFRYVSTGALFRAVSLYLVRKGIDTGNKTLITDLTLIPDYFWGDNEHVTVRFTENGKMVIFIDGERLNEGELYTQEVGQMASDIGTIPEIRKLLLYKERSLAYMGDTVMEGRDITSVVLPDAELKIYLTATIGERSQRRYKELAMRQDREPDYTEIQTQLVQRDHQDMNRAESPLKRVSDAVYIDSTRMGAEEVLDKVLDLVAQRRQHMK